MIVRAVDPMIHWMDFTDGLDDGERVSPGWVAGAGIVPDRAAPGPSSECGPALGAM